MKKILKYSFLIINSFLLLFLIASCGGSKGGNNSNSSTSGDNQSDTKYTVTWKNWNGETLEVDENVEYGSTPKYDGNTPTKEKTAEFTYIFDNWDKELSAVTENVIYIAKFRNQKNKYIITWKNWNGEVLKTDTDIEYGTNITYSGQTPLKPSDQNNQYIFEKWDKEVTPVTGDTEYTAVFKSIAFTYCTVSFNSNGGTSVNPQSVLKGEKASKPANPTREGYTFDDWYYQGERWSFVGYTVTENMTLEAKWNINSYNLSLNKNISDAGTIFNNIGLHNYNETITIRATTNPGYTFIGWYDGDKEITKEESYTFKMPTKNLSYTARWAANTDTQYKVEHYIQNIDNDNYTIDTTETLYGETNTYTQASAKEYTGFNTPSVSQQIINGDGSTTIKLYYDKKICEITAKNNDNACKLTGIGKYKYGSDCTIQLTPYLGYIFDGIYINDEFVTKDLSYTIQNISDNIELEFKWLVLPELENFEFTSTINTLTITNVIDKTKTSIVVPDIVTYIQKGAFSGCSSLESIAIPFVGDKEHTISDGLYHYQFGYIFGITSYNGSSGVSQEHYDSSTDFTNYDYYYIPTTLKKVIITGSSYIPHGAFYNCNLLTSIEISDSVTSIDKNAFYNCSSMTSIVIGKGVKEISFYNCISLQKIYYKGTIEDWCDVARNRWSEREEALLNKYLFYILDENGDIEFNGNKYISLEEIIIPDTVTKINDFQFSGFYNLKSIKIGKNVTKIGDYAFLNCSSLKSIEISNSITSIGDYAFVYCSSLKSIEIPNNVTSIGDYAFYNCSSLESIEIPNSVTSIGEDAFYNCTALEYIEIPNSITSIEQSVFSNCISLKYIELPNSLTSIEQDAFSNCTSLEYIEIPNSVIYIGEAAFEDCNSLIMNEYNNVYYIGNSTNPYLVLMKVNDNTLTTYIINPNCKIIYCNAFEDCKSLVSIEIPNSVIYIGEAAFENCSTLENVYYNRIIEDWCNIEFKGMYSNPMYYATNLYILDEAGDIEYNGNKYSLLTDLVIPSTITKFSAYQFYNCSTLENVYYNGTIEDWCNIEFEYMYSNPMYYATNFYLLDEAGDIEYNGNKYLLFTDLLIPNTITKFSAYQFYNCSSLENVYYNGTIEDWCNIEFTYMSSNPMRYATNFYLLDEAREIEYKGNKYSLLTELVIPETLTIIGYQFVGFSCLTNIVIPDSVTRIYMGAFNGCSSLESITIPFVGDKRHNYLDPYQYPFGYIFGNIEYEGATLIEQGYYDNYNSTYFRRPKYYIPSGLKRVVITGDRLVDYSFYNCSILTELVISTSVLSIPRSAFEECYSIEKVYYEGTKAQWSNAGISTFSSSSIYYYSEEKPEIDGKYWHYVDGEIVIWE